MGLNTEVISCPITIGNRRRDPVCVQTEQIEQLPADNRDFGRINAVRAKQGTTAAFGALEEIGPPLLQHIICQFSCPGNRPKKFSRRRVFLSVDRSEKLGPENRHIFGISAANKEMTLVSAGTASHADIHEDL